MSARQYEFTVTVDGDTAVITPESMELSLSSMAVMLVGFNCDLLNSPEVNVYRKIKTIENCTADDYCYFFGSTCDRLYLPPGDYEFEPCIDGAKYLPNGEFPLTITFEDIDKEYVQAVSLNGQGCCEE